MQVTANPDSRTQQLLAGQLGLLYGNANLGVAVNIAAASILASIVWGVVPHARVLAWWLYIVAVALARLLVHLRYRRAAPVTAQLDRWRRVFSIGVGFAGIGWGASSVLLYSAADPVPQVFLFFVLGGMMLGAAALLAPVTSAFTAFLVPAGFIPTLQLLLEGDRTHLSMSALAAIFTLVTLSTTKRMQRAILSSLALQFENQDLVVDLRQANQETEALNQALEQRVDERTVQLQRSTEQLRAEIAQRQQAEEELLRTRKLESLGVLAGGIAHDFNNFLTIVQGNIEVARAELGGQEPAQVFLERATSACLRAKSLSSQLLTFAKGGTPVRRVVSLAQLVTDAVQQARSGSPVGIDMSIAEGLWSAEVDPGQIGQVFHNILLNAREAMPSGSVIEVRAKNVAAARNGAEHEPRVRVSIRDHGSGIAPEVLRRIFDPYFTTKPGGNGLGLATAYAIVVKHGGRISAESTLGEGTELTVDLPASTRNAQAAPAEGSPADTGHARLLVMDDDPLLRVLLQAVLTQLGYDVQAAADGGEALALYQKAKAEGAAFDAVVLDVTVVGGMGGVETAAKLKALDPSVRMVVSSGYSEAPVMSHYADFGFDAVLEKPWTVQQMSEVLRGVLKAHSVQ